MSYAELAQCKVRIERLKIEKQNAERAQLRERIIAMVKDHGLEIGDLFGKGRKGKGSVAIKYRDPQNPENTWSGRGRMPRCMTAATKAGKAKKEDFLAEVARRSGARCLKGWLRPWYCPTAVDCPARPTLPRAGFAAREGRSAACVSSALVAWPYQEREGGNAPHQRGKA